MPRKRFGVVLLVPPPFDREIEGLRRGIGDRSMGRVAPHITLVPPVNVRVEEVPAALRVLRDAAAALATTGPFDLTIGPVRTFAPVTDTLYLAVGEGDAEQQAHVGRVRDLVFRTPLERELDHPFVPHVTIGDEAERARIDAALVALADYTADMTFDRIHLLEEQRIDGHRRWVPVADMPFEAPVVVGRGGVELEISRSQLVDPEAATVVAAAWSHEAKAPPAELLPAGAVPIVVTARRHAVAVGVGEAWVHPSLGYAITALAVLPDHRRQGVARQLRLALERATAAESATA